MRSFFLNCSLYSLFLTCDNGRETAVMKAVDLINGEFRSNTMRVSSISAIRRSVMEDAPKQAESAVYHKVG